MRKLISYITGLAIIMSLSAGAAFAKSKSPVTLSCNDTIAGYSSEVEVSTLKDTKISILLETPSGRKVYLQERSNEDGELTISIADYHLQKSGDYYISARFTEKDEEFGRRCSFAVYPSDISVAQSSLTVDRKTAEAGIFENIIAEVKLVDSFGNPVKGHSVELISSRTGDEIQLLSKLPYTDDNGAIAFLVNSEDNGMSTLSAIDLTEEVTLNARTKIAFISPDAMKAIGGMDEFEYDSYFEDASIFLTSIAEVGEVYELIVELTNEEYGNDEEENKIEKNQSVSMSVTAVDELGSIVPNYTGTIRFSSTDENANLPEDYTFTNEDLGVHDFDLGIVFKTEGAQVVSVNDINSFAIKGESEFEIIPSELTAVPSANKEILLTSPREGTYSSNTVKISGSTSKNTELQIFDTDFVIQEVTSNKNGVFDVELKNIEEGAHTFYVVSLGAENNIESESEHIEIVIDTISPVIQSFSMEAAAEIGTDITATLISEAGLAKVSILIEDRMIEMSELIDTPGTYEKTFTAPKEAGEFEIDLVLKDAVGNEGSFPNQTKLNVTAQEVSIPTQVTEITAVESDGRVTFTWAAAEDDTYITAYKLSYGPDPKQLILDVTTFDSSTTWYIPNLINEEVNYFGIQAIDSEGNLGPISELVMAMAKTPEPKFPASLEDPVILEELPVRTPETGPRMWLMIIASLLIVDIFYRRRRNA